MIKVIIAEDQQLILKDLCNKVSKIDTDISIVATALNGKEAYEKILELQPDIVFTDISMPILNGIQMIQQIRKDNIDTHFVIISGYKDFDYARDALKYGVDEYLLKPILTDDIKIIFNKLKSKISTKRLNDEQHLVDDLINSSIADKLNINTDFSKYNEYYLILFIAGPYSSFTIDYITPFCDIWDKIDLLQISKKYFSANSKMFLTKGKHSNEMIYVLATNENLRSSIDCFCNDVIHLCKNINVFITCGISRSIKHLENIGIQGQIIRTILKKNIVFSKSSSIDCSKIPVHTHNRRTFLTDDMKKKFTFMFQNNKKDEFIKEFGDVINIFHENDATQFEIDRSLKELLNLNEFSFICKDTGLDIDLEIDECISASTTYDELFSNLIIIINNIIDQYHKLNYKTNYIDDFIEKSKDYIHLHFSDEINVNDISNVFSVSPTYFSRLFKKKEGIPPVVYLTNYRIKKACEYFTNTNFTVREVAELCGYSDPFYFSKAFKSIIGIPPKEYKLRFKE